MAQRLRLAARRKGRLPEGAERWASACRQWELDCDLIGDPTAGKTLGS
jgi:hypothetical protein